jgi:hypothetical protein
MTDFWFRTLVQIKYKAGYLFGATPDSPRAAVRWRFEYELAF